jgi:branched-chain amino acid transport system substrate-binding protein
VRGRRATLPALVLLLLNACSVGPPGTTPATVEIAIDLPLTGAQSTDAGAALDEARSVIQQNFGGRVEGLPIRLRVIDESAGGRRDPVEAAHQLGRSLASPSLLGVIGPLDSDVAQAEIPIAAAAHLAIVSPMASNACLTKPLPECDGLSTRLRPSGPPSFFRLAPADDGEAAALVRFAIRQLRSSSFAVGSDGQAYGTVLKSRFASALARDREGVAYSANLDPTSGGQVDAFLAAAKQAGADAVLFGGRADGGGCRVAAKLAAGLGPNAVLLGGGGLAAASCVTDAGEAAPSVYTIGEGAPQDAGLAARVLIEAIATAIKGQGGNLPTREQVRSAVSQSKVVAFDAGGDPVKGTFTVYQGKAPAVGVTPASVWTVAGTVGG